MPGGPQTARHCSIISNFSAEYARSAFQSFFSEQHHSRQTHQQSAQPCHGALVHHHDDRPLVAQLPLDRGHCRDAGVYSRQNTSRGAACAGVRAADSAASEPKRMSSEDTTLSFAMKPVMRAVEMRQSAKPKGPNSGAMSPAMRARMLACGSAVSRSCRSKFCKTR